MTGQQLKITAVAIPATLDAGTDQSAAGTGGVMDFHVCHALREKHELEKWGDLDRCPTAMESLEYWRGNEYEERRLFIARLGQETVGTCSVTLPLRENTYTAGIMVDVAAAFRRQGWGRRLLEHAEAVAAESGRTSLDAYCELPAGPVENAARLIPAKSGAGGLPADDPAVAFAAGAGYELEQVERASRLTLPVPANQLDTLEMEASVRAAGYVLVGWSDTCPDELVTEYAVLKNRMSTDVPIAGMDWEAEDWDPARVRQEEQSNSRSGLQSQVAAALHRPTGKLVAYTVLNWRPGIPASIAQQDTLVSSGHRGKRLGLLIKAANLRAAQHRWPAARSVLTWNAAENRHMLAINNLLGFKPAGYEGEWQKRLG
ncbi:GNAT family N-acetyltransferase [Pseudarthrobacter sp. SSS035]|uniref:GNAT family N-acetyltransferase n=1 Tax=Pseudarthrobacter sp. SSS035 TaxID=2931399 RepID=UPI00200C6C27|nr:GNAT family N-acetyltransferase [Pseudarthrobacter sp. SSS035]